MTREHVTSREAAEFLGIKPAQLRAKRRAGEFTEGTHYFKPRGMRLRWKLSALVDFIENRAPAAEDGVPLARGRRVA